MTGLSFAVPLYYLRVFNEADLSLVIGGLPTINVTEWKTHTEYVGYSGSHQVIKWFWKFVEESDQETRAKILHFVTGSSAPPPTGFGAMSYKFKITQINRRVSGTTSITTVAPQSRLRRILHWLPEKGVSTTPTVNLPQSHTCFNMLDLPEYISYEELTGSLKRALEFGDSFGIS